jgi:hypothetical protein
MIIEHSESSDQQKVVFPFNEGAETMWCDALANGLYRLDNVPLFSYGLSLHDILSVRNVEGDPRPYFDHVVEKSNNKTCRITILEDVQATRKDEVEPLLERVREQATARESYGEDYIAFNIPPSAEMESLIHVLDTGEERGLWEWEMSSDE